MSFCSAVATADATDAKGAIVDAEEVVVAAEDDLAMRMMDVDDCKVHVDQVGLQSASC